MYTKDRNGSSSPAYSSHHCPSKVFFYLAAFFLITFLPVVGIEAAESNTLSVKVKATTLRSQPQFWGSKVAGLSYGDQVTMLESEPNTNWFKVRSKSGSIGYLHTSSVTEKKVVLKSSGDVSSVPDQTDVVLAGKGFSKEIEKDYAAQNPNLNFKAVDAMERIKVSDQEVLAFLAQGKLSRGGK